MSRDWASRAVAGGEGGRRIRTASKPETVTAETGMKILEKRFIFQQAVLLL
jgi:hypothetical protein